MRGAQTCFTPVRVGAAGQGELWSLDWELPAALHASEPAEARGLARDDVRLLVSHLADDRMEHRHFRDIADVLQAGDVLVLNTSGTLNAALQVTREDGEPLELHLSSRLPADLWSVELRQPGEGETRPFLHARAGERLRLPGGGEAHLLAPHHPALRGGPDKPVRLWLATLSLPCALHRYLAEWGFPIRYGYVPRAWPLPYYQTVYATEMGSAEMPSAGRAFTPELITRLAARGVQFAPLLLHTGVASLEAHEAPYEEWYRVPTTSARLINSALQEGRRVIAVGTTSVRAVESVTDEEGTVHPGEGWTTLVISHDTRLRAISGLLTGLHEPRATHLAMLEALAGRRHLERSYREALDHGYLWHEFGDLHLML